MKGCYDLGCMICWDGVCGWILEEFYSDYVWFFLNKVFILFFSYFGCVFGLIFKEVDVIGCKY